MIKPIGMLRTVRHRLWLVGYYSKTRERTVWTRAVEIAHLAAPFGALVAIFLTEATVVRPAVVTEVPGRLAREPDGTLKAAIVEPEGTRPPPWTDVLPCGEWTIAKKSRDRGWPFASARRVEPPRLHVRRFDDPITVRGAALPADDRERAAIEAALVAGGRRDVLDAWRAGGGPAPERSWIGALANFMVWWLLLSIAPVILIRGLALVAHLNRGQRRERATVRASSGLCRVCNYDLRGLDYSARCPECGTLIR